MNPFDKAWALLKAPYDVGGEVRDVLYQGGKEGGPDTGYWPMSYDEALAYALMGSDVKDNAIMRQGIPQIRVAPETEQMHHLGEDPETIMVGMHPNLPHEIQSREKTAKDIEDLLAQLKDDPYADDDEDGWNDTQSEIAPFLDTSAKNFSNKKRIAHIEEQLRRLRE
jgi:hypothetical protein